MLATLTVSEDGTLTLAREFAEHMGARAGDSILVEKLPRKGLKMKSQKRGADVMGFAESLKTDIHLSIEEINQGIIEGCLAANGERKGWKP